MILELGGTPHKARRVKQPAALTSGPVSSPFSCTSVWDFREDFLLFSQFFMAEGLISRTLFLVVRSQSLFCFAERRAIVGSAAVWYVESWRSVAGHRLFLMRPGPPRTITLA